jgi:hypothetical protein
MAVSTYNNHMLLAVTCTRTSYVKYARLFVSIASTSKAPLIALFSTSFDGIASITSRIPLLPTHRHVNIQKHISQQTGMLCWSCFAVSE